MQEMLENMKDGVMSIKNPLGSSRGRTGLCSRPVARPGRFEEAKQYGSHDIRGF
mgnify:CR=1 FL=1